MIPSEQALSLSSIFLASLMGSSHCVAMCGGFISAYSAKASSRIAPHLAYHSGRLITYTSLGLIAGLIGGTLNDLSLLVGVQRGAGIFTGLLLIAWGTASLTKFTGLVRLRGYLTKHISRPFHVITLGAKSTSATQGAFLLGLSSTLLPCGWLYGYAAMAAAAGSPLGGALVMIIFWLGTLPLLFIFGASSGRLFQFLGARAPLIGAILLIAAGIFSLLGHFQVGPVPHQHCH